MAEMSVLVPTTVHFVGTDADKTIPKVHNYSHAKVDGNYNVTGTIETCKGEFELILRSEWTAFGSYIVLLDGAVLKHGSLNSQNPVYIRDKGFNQTFNDIENGVSKSVLLVIKFKWAFDEAIHQFALMSSSEMKKKPTDQIKLPRAITMPSNVTVVSGLKTWDLPNTVEYKPNGIRGGNYTATSSATVSAQGKSYFILANHDDYEAKYDVFLHGDQIAFGNIKKGTAIQIMNDAFDKTCKDIASGKRTSSFVRAVFKWKTDSFEQESIHHYVLTHHDVVASPRKSRVPDLRRPKVMDTYDREQRKKKIQEVVQKYGIDAVAGLILDLGISPDL